MWYINCLVLYVCFCARCLKECLWKKGTSYSSIFRHVQTLHLIRQTSAKEFKKNLKEIKWSTQNMFDFPHLECLCLGPRRVFLFKAKVLLSLWTSHLSQSAYNPGQTNNTAVKNRPSACEFWRFQIVDCCTDHSISFHIFVFLKIINLWPSESVAWCFQAPCFQVQEVGTPFQVELRSQMGIAHVRKSIYIQLCEQMKEWTAKNVT